VEVYAAQRGASTGLLLAYAASRWEDINAKGRRAWVKTKLVIGILTTQGSIKKSRPEDDDPDLRRPPPVESTKGGTPFERDDEGERRAQEQPTEKNVPANKSRVRRTR
jgi:hypothetical protein